MRDTFIQENSASEIQRPQPEARPSHAEKKQFVEPEVSSPVDVLEATTFFQFSDSGAIEPL